MRVGLVAVVCGLVGLAGCSSGVIGGTSGAGGSQTSGTGVAGAKVTGVVHGGQNPISGAHVYLFAAASGASGAGQAAYGGPGIAASTSNASVSLLNSASTGHSDSVGAYVLTQADGSFTISGDYTCTAGQQVYLYVLGGDPGLGTGVNAAAGLMAVLGSCPAGGNFLSGTSPVTYVVVNEVSTVAAAYAMAGFATDATHVGSSGTPLALTGIANAFANAANLETIGTGAALSTTPAGNGTVPQAEINTLADVLAACVNSNGSGSACGTLFANAESGGTTGTVASDTASAAINIAHNPGAGVAALYGLSTASPPFGGGLTSAPGDFTIPIIIPMSGCLAFRPFAVAVDGSGNAWFANAGCVSVTELSSLGAFLSPPSGWSLSPARTDQAIGIAVDGSGNVWTVVRNSLSYANGRLIEMSNSGTLLDGTAGFAAEDSFQPVSIAIDSAGNAWTAGTFAWNGGGNSIVEFSGLGTVLSGTQGYLVHPGCCDTESFGVAIDGAGNAWVSQTPDGNSYSVAEVSNSGAVLSGASGYTGGGIGYPTHVAIDASGSAWVVSQGLVPYGVKAGIAKISNTGSFLSGLNGYTPNWPIQPSDIAIDGAGNAWIADNSGMIELSNSGSVLLHGQTYSATVGYPYCVAVDGSGDVWSGNFESFVEFIGASAPVITPIVAGLPATPTVDGSSNLGTRP